MKEIKEKYYDFAVSDFDDTLADSNKNVSNESLNIIKDFQNRGGTFCICTGRMSGAIIPILRKYQFKGLYICYNGAEICDIESGKKIYQSHVSNKTCVKLLEYAEKNSYDVIIYPNDKITVNKVTDNVRAYTKATKCNCAIKIEKVSELFKREGYTSGKVLLYTDGTDETTEKMVKEIKQLIGDEYQVGRSNKSHIDITNKDVSKGNAVLKLCEILGKNTDKLICFGDELNDLSMLKIANLSCVTANGNEKVKEIAHIITDDCDHDGVAKAIKKYCI